MQMISQPRICEPRLGMTWLAQGFRLFHRQPLAWTLILFIYWAAMLMMAFVPILGAVVPLMLAPGLAMGFIEVARAVDEQRPPAPPLLISAFKSGRGKAVLLLGAWYVLEIFAILLVSMAIDGGAMVEWITAGRRPEPGEASSIQAAAIVSMVLYVPVMMAFWFAPQLVVWSGFSPVKALFFSFFAVWRNRGAFLRYALTWVGLTLFVGAVSALMSDLLDMDANTMGAFLFPITLILMAVAHGSFYQSTKDIFGITEPGANHPSEGRDISDDERNA